MTASTTSAERLESAKPPKRRRAGLSWLLAGPGRELYSAIAFLLIFVIYAVWLGPRFLSPAQRLFDVHGNAPLLVLGLAVLITLIAGHFDLSAASLCSLATFLTVGLSSRQHWPFAVVLVAVLAIGVAAGLANGLLVTKVHVNAFIATLGTAGLFTGIASVYSGGNAISPSPTTGQLPRWFLSAGQYGTKAPLWLLCVLAAGALAMAYPVIRDRRPATASPRAWAGVCAAAMAALAGVLALLALTWGRDVSVTIVVLLVIATAMWTLLRYTVYGRYVRAAGHNAEAASLAGVRTDRVTLAAFVIGGLLAAVSGILLAANLGSAQPGVGTDFLLPAFAAAFLSTVILSPGRFTVWGAVFGGIFVIWISQGLVIGGVEFTWTSIVQGLALVITVAFSTIFRRRK